MMRTCIDDVAILLMIGAAIGFMMSEPKPVLHKIGHHDGWTVRTGRALEITPESADPAKFLYFRDTRMVTPTVLGSPGCPT
jgi:hypothetical protein